MQPASGVWRHFTLSRSSGHRFESLPRELSPASGGTGARAIFLTAFDDSVQLIRPLKLCRDVGIAAHVASQNGIAARAQVNT
jgi:hypothetical protein